MIRTISALGAATRRVLTVFLLGGNLAISCPTQAENSGPRASSPEALARRLEDLRHQIQALAEVLLEKLDAAERCEERTKGQTLVVKRLEVELAEARTTEEHAEIALKEYTEGIYPEDEKTADAAIELARADLGRARDRVDGLQRLKNQGGEVTAQEQELADLSVRKAELELKQAQEKRAVLQRSTRPSEIQTRESAIARARSNLQRKQNELDLERSRLASMERRNDLARFSDEEKQILVLLDDAARLQQDAESATAGPARLDPPAIQQQIDQAQSKLDEASQRWKRVEWHRTRKRLSDRANLFRRLDSKHGETPK